MLPSLADSFHVYILLPLARRRFVSERRNPSPQCCHLGGDVSLDKVMERFGVASTSFIPSQMFKLLP